MLAQRDQPKTASVAGMLVAFALALTALLFLKEAIRPHVAGVIIVAGSAGAFVFFGVFAIKYLLQTLLVAATSSVFGGMLVNKIFGGSYAVALVSGPGFNTAVGFFIGAWILNVAAALILDRTTPLNTKILPAVFCSVSSAALMAAAVYLSMRGSLLLGVGVLIAGGVLALLLILCARTDPYVPY